jgi:hypothetical protein
MKIRDAQGVEITLTRYIRQQWVSTLPETDAAAASMARLIRVLWRMGQVDENEIFDIISGGSPPEGVSIVDKPSRGAVIPPDAIF